MPHSSEQSFASLGRRILLCAAALAAFTPTLAHADTVTLSAQYFTLSPADPDTHLNIDGPFYSVAKPTLGPNGMPLYNPSYGGQTFNDTNSVGELTYWMAGGAFGNANLTATGTGTITVPYDNASLFPPNGTGAGNANGFQTAIFSGLINVPTAGPVDFSVGADDEAFVYLDGTIACNLGGIHAAYTGGCSSMSVGAGTHTLQIFYADLHTTQAELNFSITTPGVTGVTPEPPSLLLLASALLGLGALQLRRQRLGEN